MPVELSGVNNLLKSLKAYAPDLDKQLKSELKEATSNVVKQARGFATAADPLSNWTKGSGTFPLYETRKVVSGIRLSLAKSKVNSQGFSSSVRIVNASAAGAIYETAGRKSPNSTFVKNINKKSGTSNPANNKDSGRLIYRAWQADNGKTFEAVVRAILKTNDLFVSKSGGYITSGIKKVS
jgi:hypothetical protein